MKFFIFSLLLVAVSGVEFDFDSFLLESGNDDGKGSGIMPPGPDTPEPPTEPEEEMSFPKKIKAIEKLLIEIIENVPADEKGFVPHDDFVKPGNKAAKIAVEIKELVIKAIKPIKKIAGLAMQDIQDCEEKLANAFKATAGAHKQRFYGIPNLPGRGVCGAVEKQAGQCFFVIHRPFVVMLRQAMDEGLFDEPKPDDKQVHPKRSLVRLIRDMKRIQMFLGKYSDGKPDFPYVSTALGLVKEGSEFFHRVGKAAELVIHDYITLGHKLLEHIKEKEVEKAQCLAGRIYLSTARRILKVMAVLKRAH